jgi:hypothetical protein
MQKGERSKAAPAPERPAGQEVVEVREVAGPKVPVDVQALAQALAAPFERTEVKWKAQVVSGNRALAVAFVDARVIQDRLDEVLGVMGWQDSYECLPDGAVVCRLRIRLGDEWITKMDVGGQSEQPDEGDRRKAAFSDALKRAAVKFGIGRYLYRLPAQWVDYDPVKKQLRSTPQLPPSAIPSQTKLLGHKDVRPAANGAGEATEQGAPDGKQPEKHSAGVRLKAGLVEIEAKARSGKSLPANGEELQKRLYDYDERLAREGLCAQGDLVKHVVAAGVKAGFERDLSTWTGPAIPFAVEQTRAFEARLRKSAQKKEVA